VLGRPKICSQHAALATYYSVSHRIFRREWAYERQRKYANSKALELDDTRLASGTSCAWPGPHQEFLRRIGTGLRLDEFKRGLEDLIRTMRRPNRSYLPLICLGLSRFRRALSSPGAPIFWIPLSTLINPASTAVWTFLLCPASTTVPLSAQVPTGARAWHANSDGAHALSLAQS